MTQQWYVVEEIDYEDELIINGIPQFGFHVHTGECYLVHFHRHFVGLVGLDGLVWTAGKQDPGLAPDHYAMQLTNPKFISRSFSEPVLYIASNEGVYRLSMETMRSTLLIDATGNGIQEVGNCVADRSGHIWINDITGYRIFRFDQDGHLIETLGSAEPGLQLGEVPFEQASFSWMYDLRLAPDDTLYVLDSRNYAVRHLDPQARTVTTICGDGTPGSMGDNSPAAAARLGGDPSADFDGPWSIFINDIGDIFIGDTHNHAVRMISADDGVIRTIIGGDVSPGTILEKICGMDYRGDSLLVPDWREAAPNTLIIAVPVEPLRDTQPAPPGRSISQSRI